MNYMHEHSPDGKANASSNEGSSHILIVDDEAPIVDLLCVLLEDEGFRVSGETSATDAIRTIRNEQPDVVITDVMMPDMNGYELAQAATNIDPDTRVVLMSAVVDRPATQRYPFIPKPFELGAVIDMIDDELSAS